MNRRTILSMVAVLIALLLLAGCGTSPAQPSTPATQPTTPTTEPTTPAAPATDDTFPAKTIENIVAWSAGGSTDLAQRMLASFTAPHLGQGMVIVNKPGGAAVPGTHEIAKATPDGYTVGGNWYASFTLRPHLLDVPFSIDDFEIILAMARQRNAIAVRADSPFQSLQDLVDYAKANPNGLQFSGSPTASLQHLIGMDFNLKAGIETQFIPYDGGRPAAVALLGGHLDYIVAEPVEFSGEVASGEIRLLGMCTADRSPDFPDAPTCQEQGFDVAHSNMMIILAPAGIPADRVQKLHDGLKAVLEDEEFKGIAKNIGLELEYKAPDEVKAEIVELYEIYGELVAKIS